mmetsp:Transcript_80198/g.214830  ORF Transcript_80198/g.214830 Transcript_80198/m.214830 type:complete len:110 (+) Transcript_80198:42-371(+)
MLSATDKDSARTNRLGRQRLPEEKKIHDTVLKEAAAKCRPEIDAFARCDKTNGLLVIFKCREENKKMLACFAKNTTEEHYQVVRERRAKEREAAKAAQAAAEQSAQKKK